MYQTIHERVRVAGIFDQADFKPIWFVWRRRKFNVEKITLVSDLKDGAIKKKMYSVLADGNLYRLDHCPAEQTWVLEQTWID